MEDLDRAMDRFLARWAFVRARNMESFAAQTARWLGLSGPPRLAREAFHRLGIGVAREALPAGVLAVWCVEERGYVVRLSPFLTGARANFTLWHEFFEILAARPRFPEPPAGRAAERLADRFAACLTMPPAEVRAAARPFFGSGDKSGVLAARFGVSRSAMRHRLRELRLPPFDTPGARVPRNI
jgi:hypothetical protein